jgi:hypothetical protein
MSDILINRRKAKMVGGGGSTEFYKKLLSDLKGFLVIDARVDGLTD